MGTWSVALYGNDSSADLRGEVRELLRAPLDASEIVAALTEAYPGLGDSSDEEHCDLWLALADQLHAYAVEAPGVMATAVDIIDTRRDLAGKRALGMGERDLVKRARLLDDLRRKWAQPHPRPLTRRVQSRPDAFVFDVGDCVAYPVASDGGAITRTSRGPKRTHAGSPPGLARWPCSPAVTVIACSPGTAWPASASKARRNRPLRSARRR